MGASSGYPFHHLRGDVGCSAVLTPGQESIEVSDAGSEPSAFVAFLNVGDDRRGGFSSFVMGH
jgi:hypothetical protein